MAKNQRSATLPPNLRHNPPQADHDGDNFFSKLKKRFKFKKGKYSVDVNTGECENVSAVSFKKRESREIVEQESPWVHQDKKERETKSESPKSTKPIRTQSDRYVPPTLYVQKSKQEGKNALVESQSLSYTFRSSKVDNSDSSLGLKLSSKSIDQNGREAHTGNEYSFIKFNKDDPVTANPLNLEKEASVSNECLVHDDSAIDLDNFDSDHTQEIKTPLKNDSSLENSKSEDLDFDQGCKKLPDVQKQSSNPTEENFQFEPGYASVKDVQNKTKETPSPLTPYSESSNEFDPNYESVSDVKRKIQAQFAATNESSNDSFNYLENSRSVESLDDPRYQSVKDVKKNIQEKYGVDDLKPHKTYDISKSIESLDEPGYESLNDVKKRVIEMNSSKNSGEKHKDKNAPGIRDGIESLKPEKLFAKLDFDMNDSALSLSMHNESLTQSGGANLQISTNSTNEYEGEVNVRQLTESSKSKDSGFESKVEKSPDRENEEELYSKVKKGNPASAEDLYSQVKKITDNKSTGTAGKDEKIATKSLGGDDNKTGVVVGKVTVEYDSETELTMDPGYAECADAIKGFVPYGLYSDDSGSKISSCASLDLSAEDFQIEPGYAECADAIKTGAIKKISVSHERLVETAGGFHKSSDDVSLRQDVGSEIYANPQVLFRKRSKLLEDRSSGEFSTASIGRCSDIETVGSSESISSNLSLNIVRDMEKETKKVEVVPPVAPPLPARNYSLYLDNEEAEEIAPSPCDDSDKTNKACGIDDDAFEQGSHDSVQTAVFEKSDSNEILNTSKTNLQSNELVGFNTECSESFKSVGACSSDSLIKEKEHLDIETHTNEKKSKTDDGAPDDCDNEECLHITVQDKSGSKKVLKILEKTDSFELQKRRKSIKQYCDSGVNVHKNNEDTSLNCANNTCVNSNYETNETKDSEPKSENRDLSSKQSVHSTNAFNDVKPVLGSYLDISMETDTGINGNVTYQTHCTKGDTSDVHGKTDVLKVCEDPIPGVSLNYVQLDDVDTVTTGETTTKTKCDTNLLPVALKNKPVQSLETSPVYDRGLHLGYAGAVKMQSVSTLDSDSDDSTNIDQLPKLEINESDWECFEIGEHGDNKKFTFSDKIDDIKSVNTDLNEKEIKSQIYSEDKESALSKGTLVVRLGSHMNETSTEDVNTVVHSDSVALAPDESGVRIETITPDTSNSVSNTVIHAVHAASDLDPIERKSTLESRLCVIDSTSDGSGKALKLIDQNCDVVNMVKHETVGDNDKIEGVVKVEDTHSDENEIGCENCAAESESGGSEVRSEVRGHTNEIVVPDESRLKQLHVLYGDINPNLYQDTEPTHMSLRDVMGSDRLPLGSNDRQYVDQDDSVFERSRSPRTNATDPTVGPNTFVAHIPNSSSNSGPETETTAEESDPPPIPPHGNSSSQSNSRISGCSQSSHSTVDSPPDGNSHAFTFASGSGQSDDEAPPAIPPRTRVRREPRPVSASPDFMESMRQLKDCGWYWGPLSWEEAELKLANKPEGTFLVRDSSDERYILSLSFKNQGRVHHTRIEHHKGHFSFWSQPDSHGKSTIKDFIEQCVNNSRNGRFLYFIRPSGPGSPPMPIHLLHPVSRFIQMRSLQHMCRFRIVQLVRRDHIDNLPVPTRIKQYLKEAQYYVEYLDD